MSKQNTLLKVLFTSAAMMTAFTSHASWDSFWGKDKIQDTDQGILDRTSENIGSVFSSCAANQCKDMAGLINCLITNDNYKKWEGSPFFKKNSDGTYMQRITNVAVALSTRSTEGSDTTFQVPITIPIVVNVISPAAFKAFQEVARQNPHCMQTFCKRNCLLLQKIDSVVIENQVKQFDGQSSITVGDVVYKSPEVPANKTKLTERVNAIDLWTDMDPEKKSLLAERYLLDQANNITSLRCLSETDGGVKLRMFCSQCATNLDKGDLAMISKTCTSFDSSRNVGYGMELAELSEDFQRELAQARLEQERDIQMKALAANNPSIKDASPDINFSAMATKFSAGLPGFSTNPGGVKF
jgi:hypothetical protein